MDLFESKQLVKICAPMVRYSRLPFRLLVRDYDCDIAFTPMIMSDSFVKSEKCRDIEFITNSDDNPLIVQFAANNAAEFAGASEHVYRHCKGVDLNCGCPQRWAIQEGIGACLLRKPEFIADILRQTRNRISDPSFSISVKIRILSDLQRTVDLCRQLEATGISFLTVHGRTIKERSQPVHEDVIRAIVDALDIPVVANGDVTSLEKAHQVQEFTGAKGVMAARAILENPALYAGYDKTPLCCIEKWILLNHDMDSHFTMFHRHLMHMCEHLLNKSERKVFNGLTCKNEVLKFLSNRFDLQLDNFMD